MSGTEILSDSRQEVLVQPGHLEVSPERLSIWTMLCFGLPTFGRAAMEMPLAVHLPRFYSDVMLVPLGLIAVAIAMGRAFDAITDPVMGWISDRTRTRWGRRLPWIALGVPLAAIAYSGLFSPPMQLSGISVMVWFGVLFMLYFMFSTIYQVPQEALGAELTFDYNERSKLFGIMSFCTVLGLLLGAILPVFFQEVAGLEIRSAYSTMGFLYSGLIVVLFLPFLFKLRERPEFSTRKVNPLVPGVRRALRNRPCRILLGAAIMSHLPSGIPLVMMPYLTYYVLQPENPERWLMFNLLAILGSGFIFLPFWIMLSRRIGKLRTRLISAAVGISATMLLFTVQEGATTRTLLIYAYLGSMIGTRLFLLPSMGADVIDYDELRTGRRREGQFAAFWTYIPKLVAVPSLSVPLAVLGFMGYMPNQAQTPEVIFTIRALTSIFPAVFFFAGFIIILFYPISEEVHKAIRAGIDAHKRGESAVDPLTQEIIPPPGSESVGEEVGWLLNYFSFTELRRIQKHGPARIVRDVWTSVGVSSVLLGLLVFLAFQSLTDLEVKPGFWTVLWIVSAGFALTALVYHAMRVAPARKMASEPVASEVIDFHLTKEY